jgi:Ca2+-binding RTX toxin-like protein
MLSKTFNFRVPPWSLHENFLYAGIGNNVINGGTGTDTVTWVCGATGVTASLASGSGNDTLIGLEQLIGSSNANWSWSWS